mmetsp:Transcript_26847/g.36984  ORF Transcript_26847/g.36984 Transcript_26847/m.36984 type:complete len:368 (-) Transcript_26847:49-1152(-)
MDTSRKPTVTQFTQQRLQDLKPNCTINILLAAYFIAAIVFIPIGSVFNSNSRSEVQEYKLQYDGDSPDVTGCSITESNAAKTCEVKFQFDDDISGPIYVYYELNHFYQNHRRYVRSRSPDQLMGQNLVYSEVESDCFPIITNNSLLLNPCGLIANTFFNDIISLSKTSLSDGYTLDTDGITWYYDNTKKFKQVDGFVSAEAKSSLLSCSKVLGSDDYENCKSYTDPTTGVLYYYWYPSDDSVQYLYETFSDVISPLEGVENEHFINWMRTAGLPNFRKLYGKIDSDFNEGDTLSFNITLNFEVASYDGSKSLVITTLGYNGSASTALGNAYIIVGVLSLLVGCALLSKRLLFPRPLGDIRALDWVHR